MSHSFKKVSFFGSRKFVITLYNSHLLYIVLSPLDFQAILINIRLVVCYNIYSDTYTCMIGTYTLFETTSHMKICERKLRKCKLSLEGMDNMVN